MKKTCHIYLKKYFLCDIRLLDEYECKIEMRTLPNEDERSYPKMHTIGTLALTLTSYTHDDAQ